MRKIGALCCLLAALLACNLATGESASAKRELFRHPSLKEAWRAARRSQRLILVYATMDNCHHCDKMLGQTFQAPQVNKLLTTSFEPVMVHTRSQRELLRKLRVQRFPTTIVALPNGRIVDRIEGFVEPNQLHRRLSERERQSRKPPVSTFSQR